MLGHRESRRGHRHALAVYGLLLARPGHPPMLPAHWPKQAQTGSNWPKLVAKLALVGSNWRELADLGWGADARKSPKDHLGQ